MSDMTNERLKVEYAPLTRLNPYKNNPRNNDESVEFVKNSIKNFSMLVPIVVDKDYVIIAGHTRYRACKELKMKEVPIIVADNLSEEQVKAFRLADNKASEFSTWDLELLDIEMADIELDMTQFGFDEVIDDVFDEEPIEEDDSDKKDRTSDMYNLGSYDSERTDGVWNIPTLEPCDHIPTELIGFNYMMSAENKNVGVHFFLDDYQYERVWNKPNLYIGMLLDFDCMFTPNYSINEKHPLSLQIWNVYRSRLIGQMAQDAGIFVIPTVSWGDENSYDFCFAGLPQNSVVAVSTIATKTATAWDKFCRGMDELIARVHPKTIILYGNVVGYDFGDIEVVYFENRKPKKKKA